MENKDYPIFKGEKEAEDFLKEKNVQPGYLGPYRSLAREMIRSADMEVQSSGLNLKRAVDNAQRSHDAFTAMVRYRRRVKVAKYGAAVAIPLIAVMAAPRVKRLLCPAPETKMQRFTSTLSERVPMAAPALEKLPQELPQGVLESFSQVENKLGEIQEVVTPAVRKAAKISTMGKVKVAKAVIGAVKALR